MATSGTKSFSLDTAEVIEEAYELAGLELRTGYDAATARRSLNIMFSDWANRGINLWTVEQVSLDLTSGTSSYTLNSYDVDVLEAIVRVYDSTSSTTYSDISIERISRSEYLGFLTKLLQEDHLNTLLIEKRHLCLNFFQPPIMLQHINLLATEYNA